MRRHRRRAATLITVLILLLVMATLTVTIMNMRSTDVRFDDRVIRQVRADATARGALQLAAWQLAQDTDLQTAAATILDHEADTWLTPAPFTWTGELLSVSFTIEGWPRPDELRLHARATSDGVFADRWTHLPLTREEEEEN